MRIRENGPGVLKERRKIKKRIFPRKMGSTPLKSNPSLF